MKTWENGREGGNKEFYFGVEIQRVLYIVITRQKATTVIKNLALEKVFLKKPNPNGST